MTKTDRYKKKAMLAALEKSLGVVTNACRKVGVSRDTFYRWLKEDEDFKRKVEDVSEMSLDFAESKLYKLIADENVTAILFYLKTKGKHRGYKESVEHSGGLVVNISGKDAKY